MEYLKTKSPEFQGVVYMLLCQLFFTANDAIVKAIMVSFNNFAVLTEIVFLRGVMATIFIGLLLYITNEWNLKDLAANSKLQLRGLMEALTATFFFIGLYHMPMADVYTLLNLAPILITIAGALFLAEKVGWRRWTAVLLGFLGVIIVINPTNLQFGWYFIFPLISALFIAYRDTYTKKIKKDFNVMHATFLTSLAVTIFFGVASLTTDYVSFSYYQFTLMAISAIFLIIGYFFSILTIRTTFMSTTSAFRYSTILWGMIFGYFYFNEIPSMNMIIGGIIIVCSGLFIMHREKVKGIN